MAGRKGSAGAEASICVGGRGSAGAEGWPFGLAGQHCMGFVLMWPLPYLPPYIAGR